MKTPRSVMERFEEIGRNELTGEAGLITPRAIGGVPDFSRINTWIEPGARGNLLTGKGATSDVANLTIERDSSTTGALHEWIRQYSEGRQEFQDVHVEAARQLSKDGYPAMGIIAARQVLEIPWRGGAFMGGFFGGYSPLEADEALGLSKRAQGRGVDIAFTVPLSLKKEMKSVVEKGRSVIGQSAIEHWSESLDRFQEENDTHAAGLAALELGQARIQTEQDKNDPFNALHFPKGLELIDQRLEELLSTAQVRDTAEVDELIYHLRHAMMATLRFDEGAMRMVVDREVLKRATYKLDDFGEKRTVVKEAYKHLAQRSTWLSYLFFKAEERGVGREIEFSTLRENNPGGVIWDPPMRKERRHKRP